MNNVLLCDTMYSNQSEGKNNKMAGRNYSLSANTSPPRQDIPEKKKPFDWPDDLNSDDDDLYYDDSGTLSAVNKWFMIVILFVILIFAIAIFAVTGTHDFFNGAGSSNDLAVTIARSLDDFDYENIKTYLPAGIREEGFLSDTDAFARFRQDDMSDGYVFQTASIVSDEPFDDTDTLMDGLYDTYGKRVKISEARDIAVSAAFKDSENAVVNLNVNLIAMKISRRWYLYTGNPVNFNGEPVEFVSFPEEEPADMETSVSDISYVRKVDVPEEDVKETKIPLDFYEDARKDLSAGKCKIGDVEHTMPDTVSSFSDVFSIDTEKLAKAGTTSLRQDETIGNIPVIFTDDAMKGTPLYISAGNVSDKQVSVNDADITTFYIGFCEDGLSVVLPGNVTFGASYTEFVKMYGDMDNAEDDLFRGKVADSVYKLDLANEHNKIYFGFKDGKLVEVQWYYIDMTDYRGI